MAREDSIVAEVESPFNRLVVVDRQDGLRSLRFGRDGVDQSVFDPKRPSYVALPYARVLPLFLAWVNDPRRILLAGMGGGTIPMLLRRLLPEADIHVAELDPGVPPMAEEFMGFRKDPRVSVHIGDAADIVSELPAGFDVVILDCFGRKRAPQHLAACDFLQRVRAILRPDGLAVWNIWTRHFNPQYDAWLANFRTVFPDWFAARVRTRDQEILFGLAAAERKEGREVTVSGLPSRYGLEFDPLDWVEGEIRC